MRDVTDVRFVPAPESLNDRGLLGWAGFTLDGLRIEGMTVRRTRAGYVAVFFPERVDRTGRRHRFVCPIDAFDRAAVLRGVLDELERQGAIT